MLRLIITILVIAAAPECAQARKATPSKVTKADAQKVLRMISSDKAKTRIYCEMTYNFLTRWSKLMKLEYSKEFDALFQKMYQLGKTGS